MLDRFQSYLRSGLLMPKAGQKHEIPDPIMPEKAGNGRNSGMGRWIIICRPGNCMDRWAVKSSTALL
jgi:hypothetical protein